MRIFFVDYYPNAHNILPTPAEWFGGMEDEMARLTVEISSRYPISIEVGVKEFGEIFAGLGSDEQVAVFRSMLNAMMPHRTQWDFISIELEKPENDDVLQQLREVLFPTA